MQTVPGSLLFDWKATHGLPIDFALDRLIERRIGVEWPSYIERARECGRYDFQTYDDLTHGLEDSSVPRATVSAILAASRRYILTTSNQQGANHGSHDRK